MADLEVRLCQIATLDFQNHYMFSNYTLLPFVAIVSDALKFISDIESSWSQKGKAEFQWKAVLSSRKYYLSMKNPWDPLGPKSELSKKQKRLKPAMSGLNNIDFLDILLFSGRRPGTQLLLPKCHDNTTYLDDDWLRMAGLELPDCGLQKRMLKKLDNLSLNFSNIDASFICSGRFRIVLTTRFEKHFYLDSSGYLHIFWDFASWIGRDLDLLDGHFFWDHEKQNHVYVPEFAKAN